MKPEDIVIEHSPQVAKMIAEDPAAAAAMREFSAKLRQAYDAVQRGQYATIDEAFLALGLEFEKYDIETGERIDGSFHHDMGLDREDDA